MEVRFPLSHRIGALTIVRHDELDIIVVNGALVKLTPMEYRIILPLLTGDLVDDDELMLAVYQEKGRAGAFYKHIEKLRRKLRQNDLYLHRAISVGYLLNDHAPG